MDTRPSGARAGPWIIIEGLNGCLVGSIAPVQERDEPPREPAVVLVCFRAQRPPPFGLFIAVPLAIRERIW